MKIIAKKFSLDTTSDSAGAVFVPGGNYVPGGSGSFEQDAVKWEIRIFNHLKYLNPICRVPCTLVFGFVYIVRNCVCIYFVVYIVFMLL